MLSAGKLPLILLLLSVSSYQLFNVNYLEGLIQERQEELLTLKQQNADIKGKIQAVETEVKFWQKFEIEVTRRPDFQRLLETVSSEVAVDNGYLTNVVLTGTELKLWIGMMTPVADLVDRFVKTGLFSEVKVTSSVRSDKNAGTDIVQLSLTLVEPSASELPLGGDYAR